MPEDDVAPMPGEGEDQPLPPGMVKCEITGKVVPEDEVIEIQGKKVCAEGKEELLQRLKSGELMPGEMERPTDMRRFGCIFLDGIILGVIGGGLQAVMVGVAAAGSSGSVKKIMVMQGIISLIAALISLAYFGLFHGLKGQTLGKMAGKLKVVNLDGSPISMQKGVLRALFYIGPQLLLPIVFIVSPAMTAVQVFNIIIIAYALTNCALALLDRSRQRALHDRLAGTRVIMLG